MSTSLLNSGFRSARLLRTLAFSPMHRYRVAVLGCGMRGHQHALNVLANANRFELSGLCDQDAPRLERSAAELRTHASAPAFRCYSDARTMLAEEQSDIFVFATPPSIRLPLFQLGVEAGVRAICFEKPMALSLREARAIHDLAQSSGTKYVNAHIHRYGAHWKAVKELVASGALGSVEYAHTSSKGWFLAYATHLIDYMTDLSGADRVEWVSAHAHGRSQIADGHHPSPDYLVSRLRLDTGLEAQLECGTLAPSYGDSLDFWHNAGLTLRGSEGWAQVVVGSGWRAALRSQPDRTGAAAAFRQCEDGDEYFADLARWLDDPLAFPHPCRGERTFHGFEVCVAMLLSAIERRPVTLPLDSEGDAPILARLQRIL